MADTVIRTVAANCALQFAGYCLGDVVGDPLGGTPDMRWFEVAETRGYLEEGKIAHWQVTLKVGFTLDE